MDNLSKETQHIFNVIKKYQPIRSVELKEIVGISKKNLYKHISKLIDEQFIDKQGTVPKVYYQIKSTVEKAIVPKNMDDLFIYRSKLYLCISQQSYDSWFTRLYSLGREKSF